MEGLDGVLGFGPSTETNSYVQTLFEQDKIEAAIVSFMLTSEDDALASSSVLLGGSDET